MFVLFFELFLFAPKFINVILKSILLVDFIQDSPTWVSQKIICDFMHFWIRVKKLGLFEHFKELDFINLSFGFFLHFIQLFEVNNVIIKDFFLLTNFHQSPSLIVFTHFNARLPFSVDIYRFSFKKRNDFLLNFFLLRKFLLSLDRTIKLFFFALLFLKFTFVLFDLAWKLPVGFSSESVVVKLFTLSSAVLFPIRMLSLLLSRFETLRHFILRLFGGSIVIICHSIYWLMNGPYFTFFLQSNWIFNHIFNFYYKRVFK